LPYYQLLRGNWFIFLEFFLVDFTPRFALD